MGLPFQKPAKQSTLKDLQEKQKEKTMPKVLKPLQMIVQKHSGCY